MSPKSTVVKVELQVSDLDRHYYASHDTINPTGVVPVGPSMDLDSPHGRDHLAVDRD